MKDDELDAAFADIVARFEIDEGVEPGAASADPAVAADALASDALASDPLASDPLASDPLASDPLAADQDAMAPGADPAALPPPSTGESRIVWRSGPPAAEEWLTRPVPDEDQGDDEEVETDHFVPPPLEPLPPSYDHHFWGIIIGLVAGPAILLWIVLFRPDDGGLWTWLGVGLTVAGFVLLVLRQPKDRDESDDGIRL